MSAGGPQRDFDEIGGGGDRSGRGGDAADREVRIAMQGEDARHTLQCAGRDSLQRPAGHELLGGLEDQPDPDR